MTKPMLTLSAEASATGVLELRAQVADLEALFGIAAENGAASTGVVPARAHDVVALYMRTAPSSRSREVLEVLPGGRAKALTPTELAGLMAPDPAGARLSRGSVRAAIRVVQRVTGKLIAEAVISAPVLEIDFDNYDVEGAGRYCMSEEARRALDAHLNA